MHINTENKNITGIILAGGKSSRMKTDKALLTYNGETYIDIIYNLLKPVCTGFLISSNSNVAYLKDVKHIPDEIKNCGPLGGIVSCLKESKTDNNLVITCDMPFMQPVYIEALIKEAQKNFDIIQFKMNNIIFPFPGVYKKSIITKAEQELKKGNNSPKYIADYFNTGYISIKEAENSYFKDMNTPNDLILI